MNSLDFRSRQAGLTMIEIMIAMV
ncbi:prepilin-type N-terminal cleavage/methylation domain-containing protein, partial [Thiolapillus sp.]